MITYEWLYWLAGAFFFSRAGRCSACAMGGSAMPPSGAYWRRASFFGSHLSDFRQRRAWCWRCVVHRRKRVANQAQRAGHHPRRRSAAIIAARFRQPVCFAPALIVPVTAVAGDAACITTPRSARPGLFAPRRETLNPVRHRRAGGRWRAGMIWLRPPLLAPAEEGAAADRFHRLGGDPAADAGGAGRGVRVGGGGRYHRRAGRRDDPAGGASS